MVKSKIKKPIKATPKQKKLVKLVAENVRKAKPKPMGKLMLEAGYSESQSKQPGDIVKSKGFIDLLNAAGATDEKLARKINEGLDLPVKHINSPRFIEMTAKFKKLINPLGDEAIEALKGLVQINLPPVDPLPK